MKHLLVTNDFPPKHGGIQNYLWELWRRLPSDSFAVLTSPYAGTAEWDSQQPFQIVRTREPVLLPHPHMVARINRLAAEIGAGLVMLDPAVPLGIVGPSLDLPFGVVLHGAEVTIPGRVPLAKQMLGRVLRHATVVIAAGGYPADEGVLAAGRQLPVTVIPPGVDVERFRPLTPEEKGTTRKRLGLPPDGRLILGQSRLVPRKGFDTLIRACSRLATNRPDLHVAIGGSGRDRQRLERLVAELRAPVSFLGRVPEPELAPLFGSADIFAMLCRNRWGGLEQEGFGIVFVEAAAAGVPSVAGRSGGSGEAVIDGETGFVVDPHSADEVSEALGRLLDDEALRHRMGNAARLRAADHLTYDVLSASLSRALEISSSP